jgi:Serine aminopeptidase, S33
MINALFCLWVKSGFSKGTVAGALTFFPPDPPLYQFERHTKSGRILDDDEDPEEEEDEKVTVDSNNDNNNHTDLNNTSIDVDADQSPSHETTTTTTAKESVGGIIRGGAADAAKRAGPLEIEETRHKRNTKIKSPAEQFTDQVNERRKRSKVRNALDARDAMAGVTYRLLLDPRLHVPPHDENSIEAVKIIALRGVHIAAVIYRVPNERRTPHTKTIIMSHGNATDIGAMFPIQVVIAHSLDCDVVVYDYSGYGESGGIPTECATYRDIEAVYDYTLEHVTANQNPKNVILYGQSVGSGPCCYLLAQKHIPPLGGLILHSPFTSGMRVLTPSRYVSFICGFDLHTYW